MPRCSPPREKAKWSPVRLVVTIVLSLVLVLSSTGTLFEISCTFPVASCRLRLARLVDTLFCR